MANCTINNCTCESVCRGLCEKHYSRFKRYGNTNLQRKSIYERLDNNSIPVTESGCLIWTGPVNHEGYGHISYNGKSSRVHMVSYELNYGKIPNGLIVCHKCDIPSCFNPNHLFLGTNQDNMKDRDNKGRQYDRTGIRNGRAKLDIDKANQIRKIFSSQKISKAKLGRIYGVSLPTISDVVNNIRWFE